MQSTETPTFYLVQRLESQPATRSRAGFDGHFALEYMGSSEFEWGAIPKAIKALREHCVVVEPAPVTINGRTRDVYFVGHSGVSRATSAMEAWAVGSDYARPFRGKEWTRFPEAFADEPERWGNTDAWWDIDANVAWTLNASLAIRLADAFNGEL